MNIVLNFEYVNPLVKFAKEEDGWCTHLGTVLAPKVIEKYKSKLVEPMPSINDEGIVVNRNNVPFVIVHQYDRVPELRKQINKRYNS